LHLSKNGLKDRLNPNKQIISNPIKLIHNLIQTDHVKF